MSDELRYRFHNDLRYYGAYNPFIVDGISCSRYADGGVNTVRPMIELVYSGSDPAEMFHSDPPTDAELDRYVWHGILPST
jgi:hypothetical protein